MEKREKRGEVNLSETLGRSLDTCVTATNRLI